MRWPALPDSPATMYPRAREPLVAIPHSTAYVSGCYLRPIETTAPFVPSIITSQLFEVNSLGDITAKTCYTGNGSAKRDSARKDGNMPIQHKVEYDAEKDFGTIRIVYQEGDVEQERHSVDIQFQHGTIPENGINGVTNEAVLDLLAMRIRALQVRWPCRENALAITHIEEARMWLDERTRVRILQGVEGKHENHVSNVSNA